MYNTHRSIYLNEREVLFTNQFNHKTSIILIRQLLDHSTAVGAIERKTKPKLNGIIFSSDVLGENCFEGFLEYYS